MSMMPKSNKPAPGGKVSQEVILAVANLENVEPHKLEPPLYHAVDPDALNRLYEEPPHPRVEFEYMGYDIVVEQGKEVLVDGRVSSSPATSDET